mgnify:CR=1 FL=1
MKNIILESELWKGIKKETAKLQAMIDYEKRGMLDKRQIDELEKIKEDDSLSRCCGWPVNLKGWCTSCGCQA